MRRTMLVLFLSCLLISTAGQVSVVLQTQFMSAIKMQCDVSVREQRNEICWLWIVVFCL